MYELLIKETGVINSDAYIYSGSLIDLLIKFHKWSKINGIIILHQRIRFTRINANNLILLRIIGANISKSDVSKELIRFSKTNPEYKISIRSID